MLSLGTSISETVVRSKLPAGGHLYIAYCLAINHDTTLHIITHSCSVATYLGYVYAQLCIVSERFCLLFMSVNVVHSCYNWENLLISYVFINLVRSHSLLWRPTRCLFKQQQSVIYIWNQYNEDIPKKCRSVCRTKNAYSFFIINNNTSHISWRSLHPLQENETIFSKKLISKILDWNFWKIKYLHKNTYSCFIVNSRLINYISGEKACHSLKKMKLYFQKTTFQKF